MKWYTTCTVATLLSLISFVQGTRFISKEAEEIYKSNINMNLNTKTSFPMQQANISAYLSAAAICGMEKYESMILKGPAVGFEVKSIIYDEKTDMQGYIGVLPSDEAIYVVFRGSASIKNWIVNVDAIKTEYTSFDECIDCNVHKGWYTAEQNVIQYVIQQVKSLQEIYPKYVVKVTGHSLGAAVAQLTTMDLAKNGIKTSMINFGQPRTGDVNYATFVPSIVDVATTWRVTHDKDTVVHLPPTVDGREDETYQHICTEEFEDINGIFKTCDGTCEDHTCSDQYSMSETNADDHCYYIYRERAHINIYY